MTDAPSDPGAIDLDAIKAQTPGCTGARDLIAAVEALRERVAEAESDAEHYLRLAIVDPGANDQVSWKDRAEAEKASMVEVVGASKEFYEAVALGPVEAAAKYGPDFDINEHLRDKAAQFETVLAATPVKALERARDKDQAYLERNHLVAALARLYPSGITRTEIPDWSPDWHGCVYIDLPSGQVSYHYHNSHAHLFESLPPYESGWDGHDKEMVHQRLAKLDALGKQEVAD